MSHYSVLVITGLKGPASYSEVERQVDALLAPYYEELEMPEYVDENFGRERIDEMAKYYGINATNLNALAKKIKDWAGGRGAVVDGNLVRYSTYNKNSKWDWYQIGGRWTGDLDGYDPTKDPANIETCRCCGGTGMRNDGVGLKSRREDPVYKCNGCDGKGKTPTWPTQWRKYRGDVQAVKDIRPGFIPFAIVDPEGRWHEKAEMGWWAITTNDKPEREWKAIYQKMARRYSRNCAAIVDCHI